MTQLDDLKNKLSTVWGDQPAYAICLRLVERLAQTDPKQLEMLTFPAIAELADHKNLDGDLLTALTILTSSTLQVLETKTLFIDDVDDEFEIDAQTLREAKAEGVLIHPDTGEPIPDFDRLLIPFFELTPQFKKLTGH